MNTQLEKKHAQAEISSDNINLAERITPELREYMEIELAKRITAKALIDLQIQMLEAALSLAPR